MTKKRTGTAKRGKKVKDLAVKSGQTKKVKGGFSWGVRLQTPPGPPLFGPLPPSIRNK